MHNGVNKIDQIREDLRDRYINLVTTLIWVHEFRDTASEFQRRMSDKIEMFVFCAESHKTREE